MEEQIPNSPTVADLQPHNCSCKSGRPRHLLIIFGISIVVAVWIFREPLRSWITRSATLSNTAPPPELVEEMIEQSPDRAAAIVKTWNTGKIVQRQVAIREVPRALSTGQPLPLELESIVLAGALDADMNVRESAFSILSSFKNPALPALATAQLSDCDPQIRLLGLKYLKEVDASIGVPTVIPLLDDHDPLIVTMGLKLLGNWSGEDFGVKLSDTLSFENEKTGLKEFREGSLEKAKAGADRAKIWWASHQSEFPPVKLSLPKEIQTAQKSVPAEDFSLRAIDGSKVQLSDFRGKVVLINFWTTWCPACVSEMPELIALQKSHDNKLAIIGVSLDFVPDSHGHIGGHPAVEEQNKSGEHHDDDERNAAALQRVRAKVERTAQARKVNYTILLDEKNEIGGRFNGGELPTTVIVDAEGNIRRRFIGARSLPVFEAMIAEASQPLQR
ncbi:MAG: TlpA disulfide reductase family protein [Verrucomicrobiota bacterium]